MTSHPSGHESEADVDAQTSPSLEDGIAVAAAIRDEAERLKQEHPERSRKVDRLVSSAQKNLVEHGQSDIAEALGSKP